MMFLPKLLHTDGIAMKLERLGNSNKHHFSAAFSLYESAFPEEERRDRAEHERVMQLDSYHFDLLLEGDELLGVMFYWEIGELIFLEHFTTMPQLRGKGVGSAALNLLKKKGKRILLEIEPPQDELTCRRYGFYQRNGFTMNPFHHIQAKYHLGDEDLELKILSYPSELTPQEYHRFYDYMSRHIGIQPHVSNDITVRPLEEYDDYKQVAKLIYLSDAYIYPNWFDSIEQGQQVISEMIRRDTLYAKENITVAVTAEGVVAGVVVSRMTPFTEKIDEIHAAFTAAGVPADSRTEQVFRDYYSKMGDCQDGYYIANVAIDPAYRKQGIGAAMIARVIQGHPYCSLECVVANAAAWRMYQRFGFRIAYEYPGVHAVPCYKMIYGG